MADFFTNFFDRETGHVKPDPHILLYSIVLIVQEYCIGGRVHRSHGLIVKRRRTALEAVLAEQVS